MALTPQRRFPLLFDDGESPKCIPPPLCHLAEIGFLTALRYI